MKVATVAVSLWAAAALVSGCIDYDPQNEPPPPPAQPPGETDNGQGDPPDWSNCDQAWRGQYSNLKITNPFVTPRPRDPLPSTDPTQLDWWDDPTFEERDPTIDFGSGFWPVDEGLEGDPAYFAVYWHAWVRAWSDTTLTILLGSADDSWVWINNGPVIEQPGIHDFVREPYDIYLQAGQYPIEVWFAHRGSEIPAFSFRKIAGDTSFCYPDFEETATAP